MKIGLMVKTANDRATNSARPYQVIRDVAQRAEADGFDSIWICDHMLYRRADEPTQGVDVGSKSEIHSLMVDLAERGLAIIMISSELPEILGMSDRVAVMHAGRMSGILSRQEATQQRILTLALGNPPSSGVIPPQLEQPDEHPPPLHAATRKTARIANARRHQ